MPRDICIVGILVENRASQAPEVQQVITRYGSQIISRSGIPDPTKDRGIITLTMETQADEAQLLVNDLQRLNGVSAKWMCLANALQ
ncbi:hypothetical protein IT084_04380 [Desulfallas sp. Bu1-1]|jgi:putative iron-only hydrogenase system regulator|uniref:TM1266 family iron-only hydrogenase system putative regulator n=1 Tax=Desulfallas sp. Bu1-1 TaxID=2787620 RepID=UPI00189E1D5F|nr:TM1266 family iron-only hydrogenase system putative regulator [Desulfallas sp. Bu1-1]MBF7082211.1 hypothetical protein [Desulfallas sp. Bu1-1]